MKREERITVDEEKANFTVIKFKDLNFDEFTREYVLPNGARISEQTYRLWKANSTNSEYFCLDKKRRKNN